ncbi:MAG: winged helix-turn-helix transcriptional regulator [Deltaproteobacteria bacterium]|nr:winged helix-turn-helix transcriptional regulator [Deltaproteobacteria bacterium]
MNNSKQCCADLSRWLSPDLFKALSDPNRVAILVRLAGMVGEQTVTEVASCCPINLSVVSRHLRILRDAGIVECDRRGKEVYYRARVSNLAKLLRNLADALDACCPDDACEQTGNKHDI